MKPIKFNTAHFPNGTVCEVVVKGMRDPGPFIVTVTDRIKNGPNSYCIETDRPGIVTEFESYNIDHVTRIISRGTGTHALRLKENQFDWFGNGKPKSQYITHSVHGLAYHVAQKHMNETMLLDTDKLVYLLRQQGIFREHEVEGDGFAFAFFCNKKKLNKAIKMLINKCLVCHNTRQKEDDEEMSRQLEKDWDYAWDVEERSAADSEGSSYE